MGGTYVTRLAIVDGRLFRQRPQIGAQFWVLDVLGILLAAIIGLPLSLLLAFLLRRKRVI